MNIVIFKTNALGDNVVFLPVVQALRRRFPEWKISLVTHAAVQDLYAAEIRDDDLLLVGPDEMRTAWRRPWRLLPWRRWINARRPDAILLSYDQSSVAHLLARLSPARIRLGANFGMPLRRAGLTHTVEWQPGWNFAQWHWEMARTFARVVGGVELAPTPPAPDLRHLAGD